MKINDKRKNQDDQWGFVVMEDRFLGNWGRDCEMVGRGGRSLYVIAVSDHNEAEIMAENARHRSEMRRVRINRNFPRTRQGDHVSIVDRYCAARWFERGAWL